MYHPGLGRPLIPSYPHRGLPFSNLGQRKSREKAERDQECESVLAALDWYLVFAGLHRFIDMIGEAIVHGEGHERDELRRGG